jgi:hypothetical protein
MAWWICIDKTVHSNPVALVGIASGKDKGLHASYSYS